MKRSMRILVFLGAGVLAGAGGAKAVESEASAPKGVTISAYDTGPALVSELRSVTLAKGANQIRFRQLPTRLDPATVSFSLLGGAAKLEVLEQQFQYDLGDVSRLFARYLGRTIQVATPEGVRKGILLSSPGEASAGGGAGLAVQAEDGSVVFLSKASAADEVVFPQANQLAYLEPTLQWQATASEEGPRNLRLSYAVPGLGWSVTYEAVQAGGRGEVALTARAHLDNKTGGRFRDARIRLVSTEKGAAAPLFAGEGAAPALRYAYEAREPAFERMVASAASLKTYELPRPVSLARDETKHVQLWMAEKVPVTQFYVYDGVKLDRFQRNRRNDWNYGTECHNIVETYLQFSNAPSGGLGFDLPGGLLRLYQRKGDDSVDLVGEDFMPATAVGAMVQVLLGPARGLRGERERTGYSEITPLHEYEETFEIRLDNSSAEDVEVRVVEHLYRWEKFEIMKADTEYVAAGPQAIEFRPVVKAGGKRSVHYSVRYRW